MLERDATVHGLRTRLLAEALARKAPQPGEPFPCPYLPGRSARYLLVRAEPYEPGTYHSLMDLNFRRLGQLYYRPACPACQECRALRIPVDRFRPSRAQRRCRVRNADLTVEMARPSVTPEKLALYRKYLEERHDGAMDGSEAELRQFLRASLETVEICYRSGERLLAVGIADLEPQAMSAVYCYFDPAQARRSPGVFNVLWMIEECRRRGIAHLYLGFRVLGNAKMEYKAAYRPHEVLEPDGRWVKRD